MGWLYDFLVSPVYINFLFPPELDWPAAKTQDQVRSEIEGQAENPLKFNSGYCRTKLRLLQD